MPNGRWADSDRSARLPPNWDSEIRPEVFRVYGYTCHMCGVAGANEVDHVNAGDDHSLANLRPIHGRGTIQNCHGRKSSAEGGRAAQARKPKRKRAEEPHPGMRS